MKKKFLMIAVAVVMGSLAVTANEAFAVTLCVTDMARMVSDDSDYEFVKNVTIYKSIGQTSREGKTPMVEQTAPVYVKDGEYYIKVPSYAKPVKVGQNNMYGRTDLDGVWKVDLQYHVGGWSFNI